ncbi:unnamed protein product [Ixodes persulcatus]
MAASTKCGGMEAMETTQANMRTLLDAFSSCTKKPETFLEVQPDVAETMKHLTKDLYDALGQWQSAPLKTELPSLVIDNFDDEQIWQQLELRNSRLVKECIASISRVATRSSLSFGVALDKPQKSKVQLEAASADEDVNDTEEADDAATDEDASDDDELGEGKAAEEASARRPAAGSSGPSSVVDDAFFRLADMEAFADQEDLEQHGSDSDDDIDYFGELGSDDEDEKGGQKAKYKDFFDPPPPSEGGRIEELMRRVASGSADSETLDTEQGGTDKSSFEKGQEFLKKRIHQLEEKNLQPRTWRLQGEVEAKGRPENSLLQEHFMFEHATRQPAAITEETTRCLEDVILQRVKDKAWDDVERKTQTTQEPFELRRRVALDHEKSKLSLADVYEKQFLDKQQQQQGGDADAPAKEEPAHAEIRAAMRDLFTKLDALSNFHMMPKPLAAEVKVVSNLPSINVEEVIPVGVSDASLLAPQEVKAKTKGELVAAGEKTRTQRLRERRLKKAFQKRRAAKAAARAAAKAPPLQREAKEARDKVVKAANTKLAKPARAGGRAEKSLSSSKKFFERLQDRVTSTKAVAKKKPRPDQPRGAASGFKL